MALTVSCGGERSSPGVATLELSPTSATVGIDETQTFTAVAKNADGNPVNGVNFSWASSNTAVATVSSGVATGLTAGTTQITASANGVTSNSATLSVTSAEQLSSFQLIDDALERGDLDEETALTYKVFATFSDERLPAPYRGDDTGRDSTLLMTRLASIFDTLSPAAQAILQPFLLTPAEPGSWLELSAGSKLQTQQIEWGTVVTANDKVKVWYQERYAGENGGDDARAQKIAAELGRIIWPKLTKLMREPLPDCGAACPKGGGDGRIDIYLVNINRAYTEGSAGGASSAFILLGRTDSFATVAHEFMHAVQFAYPMGPDAEYDWLFEATATWAEDYVYPKSNMDPDFPASQEEQPYAGDFLKTPETPLETTNDGHEYGAYLLPFYLAGYGREGAGAVRTMWENATQASSLGAVNTAISSRGGFSKVWPQFVLYNWNQEPVTKYQTWDELEGGASVATHFTVGAVGEDELPANVAHLSALYYSFEFTSERIHSVIVENPFAKGSEPTASVQAIVKIGGQWRAPEDWTSLDRKKFCRDKPEEHIEELVLIIGNSEWQNRSHMLGAGKLKVKALAEGCEDSWVGTSSVVGRTPGTPPTDNITSTSNVTWTYDRTSENGSIFYTPSGSFDLAFNFPSTGCTFALSPNTFAIVNDPLAQPMLVIENIPLTPPTYYIRGAQFVNFTSTVSCPGKEDLVKENNGFLVLYAGGNGPYTGQNRLSGTSDDGHVTITWDFSRP